MANGITITRILLALSVMGMLFIPSATVYTVCFILTLLIIAMDGLDGYIARKRGETSKLGAVLDIIGDRIVENGYWITFAVLGWVYAWIPLIVVIRGIITDSLRSVALERGFTAFGESTMMRSRVGLALVAYRPMRLIYAAAKALAFSLLIAEHIPGWEGTLTTTAAVTGEIAVYVAVTLCVLRGVPVIIESRRFFPS